MIPESLEHRAERLHALGAQFLVQHLALAVDDPGRIVANKLDDRVPVMTGRGFEHGFRFLQVVLGILVGLVGRFVLRLDDLEYPLPAEADALGIENALREQCPNGVVTGIQTTRESASYPYVSGEIIRVRAECETK